MLEWVLKGMLMSRTGGAGGMRAALDMVNEVGRALYFVNNPANRNIGGGLCVSVAGQCSLHAADHDTYSACSAAEVQCTAHAEGTLSLHTR